MYNVDSVFNIGKTHKVCEDFALHEKKDNLNLIVVSDGCSSSCTTNGIRNSINTDFGSRLLSLFCKNTLLKEFNHDISSLFRLFEQGSLFSYFISNEIYNLTSSLNVRSNVFDSTLMIAIASENQEEGFVCVYGDGVVFVEYEDKKVIYEIEYETNAPYYLSYLLSQERNEQYKKEFGGGKKTITKTTYTDECRILNIEEVDLYSPFLLIADKPKTIVLMSDGVSQFQGPEGRISTEEIVKQWTDYPNKKGVFLQRQQNIFNKFCAKNNYQPLDDYSVASIIKREF